MKVTKVYFVNVYVGICCNIWLSFPTVKIRCEMWRDVFQKHMYCEKFIAKWATFIEGIIISIYQGKFCLSDTNLSINNKVCVFLSIIPYFW